LELVDFTVGALATGAAFDVALDLFEAKKTSPNRQARMGQNESRYYQFNRASVEGGHGYSESSKLVNVCEFSIK
jgi:hypothetical protein